MRCQHGLAWRGTAQGCGNRCARESRRQSRDHPDTSQQSIFRRLIVIWFLRSRCLSLIFEDRLVAPSITHRLFEVSHFSNSFDLEEIAETVQTLDRVTQTSRIRGESTAISTQLEFGATPTRFSLMSSRRSLGYVHLVADKRHP